MSVINKIETIIPIPKPMKGKARFLATNQGRLKYSINQSLCYTNAASRLSRLINESVFIHITNGTVPITPNNVTLGDYPSTEERIASAAVTSTTPGVFTVTATIPATPNYSIGASQLLLVGSDDTVFGGIVFPFSYIRETDDLITVTFTVGSPVISSSITDTSGVLTVDASTEICTCIFTPYTEAGQLQPFPLGSGVNILLDTTTGDVPVAATLSRVGGYPVEAFTAVFSVPDGLVVEGLKLFPYPQPGAAGLYALTCQGFTPFTVTDGVNDPVPFSFNIEVQFPWE